MGTKNKAIGYVRVSTLEQADTGYSIDAQKRLLREVAELNSWELEMIADEGVSAKNMNRPGIQEALNKLANHEARILIATKLDRISRSVIDFATLMKTSRSQGWDIKIIKENLDTSNNTAMGSLLANIMSSFAQFEREVISERTKEGLQEAKNKGVQLGRPATLPKGTLALIQELRNEKKTLTEITNFLNEKKTPTAQGGKKWYPGTVRHVLETNKPPENPESPLFTTH